MEQVNVMDATSLAASFLALACEGMTLGGPLAKVSLTVNGNPVSFREGFRKLEALVAEHIEYAALTKAVDLVTGAELDDVRHRLQAIRMDVMRVFVDLRQRCPDELPRTAQV